MSVFSLTNIELNITHIYVLIIDKVLFVLFKIGLSEPDHMFCFPSPIFEVITTIFVMFLLVVMGV